MSEKKEDVKLEFDKTKIYPIGEAIGIVKKTSRVKFDASVEVHFRLGVDPKKNDQQIRSTIVLPHSAGKKKKIAAFVLPEQEKEAKDAGAEIVGGEELIKKIKDTKKIDFEIAVAVPGIMRSLASIAKILGPRGLMPSPKSETITTNLKKTISELQKGKVAFKNDNTGNIHQTIGKISNSDKDLTENYQSFLEALNKAKPATAKGEYIKNITICSTMGPGIKVEIQK